MNPRTFSPAKDDEISANSANSFLAWKGYNSSPQNVSVDMDDESNANVLQSFYIEMH